VLSRKDLLASIDIFLKRFFAPFSLPTAHPVALLSDFESASFSPNLSRPLPFY
jgi:hypothetical protein